MFITALQKQNRNTSSEVLATSMGRAGSGDKENNSSNVHTPQFNHHFSELQIQSPVKGESEAAEEEFTAIKGEGDAGSEGGMASKGEGKQVVKKSNVSGPTAGQCGGYSWKVKFSVENSDDKTKGYIVQKINAVYKRTDCDGKNKPVTGIGKFPYWEAWGVRNGKVFVGDTESEHQADHYADDPMGDSTKGSIVVTGVAEFFPNAVLPAHMKANNPETQAHSLRSSLTDPALSGGTGSISHDLTASWDCCGKQAMDAKEKQTTFSNQK